MTTLHKPVTRVANRPLHGRRIVCTLHPGTTKRSDMLLLRPIGARVPYVVALETVYQIAAAAHAQAEQAAKRKARKDGIPWRIARRQFLASCMP